MAPDRAGGVDLEEARVLGLFGRVGAALTRHWGAKILAFFLALVVFVVTRGNVQRSFSVPLDAVSDPDRILLTDLPESVEVRIHGPWANVNQLRAGALGTVTLDLRSARPGPMVLDPAGVVMPPGVVLTELDYDAVDLRFDAVLERALAVVVEVEGSVDDDYELRSTRIEPERIMVRGGSAHFEGLVEVRAEAVSLEGATESTERELEIAAPGPGLHFVGAKEGEGARARLVAELVPVSGELGLEVLTAPALREAIPAYAGQDLPRSERLTVRGPRATLRRIAKLDTPLLPKVSVDARKSGSLLVTIAFEWSESVTEVERGGLSFEPQVVRLRVSAKGVDALPATPPPG